MARPGAFPGRGRSGDAPGPGRCGPQAQCRQAHARSALDHLLARTPGKNRRRTRSGARPRASGTAEPEPGPRGRAALLRRADRARSGRSARGFRGDGESELASRSNLAAGRARARGTGMSRRLSDELEAKALTLLEEALSLPPAERLSWLDTRGEIAEEVRERVAGLLAREPATTSFLEPAAPSTVERAQRLTDRSGERVGAFKLVEMIGVGGMSVVYRAKRADGTFDQEVAVKLFAAAHLDATAFQR